MPDKIINRPSTQISRSLSRPAAADLIAGSQQREHVRMRTYIKIIFIYFVRGRELKAPSHKQQQQQYITGGKYAARNKTTITYINAGPFC
jgi:hypothetical protein